VIGLRTAGTVLLSLAGLLALYWLLGFVMLRPALFPAPGPSALQPPRNVERIWLTLGAGRVEAWRLPAIGGPAFGMNDEPRPLIIFTHGNGELIDNNVDDFTDATHAGVGVLMVEYPGYGRSEGSPSQASITEAVLAAYDWAARQPSVDASRIVAFGRSLGGGAACILATRRPVAGLVLQATFTGVADMAHRYGFPAFLVRDPFDNIAALKQYAGPILLLHGERDDIIPVEHSERLLISAGSRATLQRLSCGHNDCFDVWPLVRQFLEAQGLLSSPPSS